MRTRLLLFLSIALLPLGIIAVFQTLQVVEETERLAQRDALSRTSRTVEEQQVVLQRAKGAAYSLGAAAVRLSDRPQECSAIMADFIEGQSEFVFAGFIRVDGMMECNNAGVVIDYSGRPDWNAFLANPAPQVSVNRDGHVSGQSVYIAFVPIMDPQTGDLSGAQAVSIPHTLSEALFANEESGLDLALVDVEGTILASSRGMDEVEIFERWGIVPEQMDVPVEGLLIEDGARDLRGSLAALVPLVTDEIYVLGLWSAGEVSVGPNWFTRVFPAFPILMWIASLAVAYITVNNLLLGPLSQLAKQMRRHRPDRPEAAFVSLPDAPVEIMAIAESYNDLVDRVAADTAVMKETIAQKETLMREVHHRVKNNLQLISSILNMQMRGVKDEEARRILSRVQDRVMSLSAVHRALYSGSQVQTVRADSLLQEIIGSVADLATTSKTPIDVTMELRPTSLEPDQAVPLSLLATEAMTNAVKYLGAQPGATPAIDVSLREMEGGEILFRIVNTRGPMEMTPEALRHGDTGLGARLIESFASQLGGETEIDISDTAYDLQVRFKKLSET